MEIKIINLNTLRYCTGIFRE